MANSDPAWLRRYLSLLSEQGLHQVGLTRLPGGEVVPSWEAERAPKADPLANPSPYILELRAKLALAGGEKLRANARPWCEVQIVRARNAVKCSLCGGEIAKREMCKFRRLIKNTWAHLECARGDTK
jgi:hypothetical protein